MSTKLTQATVNALYVKVEASRDVCRILLNQLAEQPGVSTIVEDFDSCGRYVGSRDVSRNLGTESKNTEFLLQWARLAETLVNDSVA